MSPADGRATIPADVAPAPLDPPRRPVPHPHVPRSLPRPRRASRRVPPLRLPHRLGRRHRPLLGPPERRARPVHRTRLGPLRSAARAPPLPDLPTARAATALVPDRARLRRADVAARRPLRDPRRALPLRGRCPLGERVVPRRRRGVARRAARRVPAPRGGTPRPRALHRNGLAARVRRLGARGAQPRARRVQHHGGHPETDPVRRRVQRSGGDRDDLLHGVDSADPRLLLARGTRAARRGGRRVAAAAPPAALPSRA